MSHQLPSYRPNMNRNVTRKWAEARQVDYGGDDWGDDPYGSYEERPVQPPLSQDRRSHTNPPTPNTSNRLSFDRGDERQGFPASDTSSSAAPPAFPSPQPVAPRYYEQHQGYAPPPRQQTMPMQGTHTNMESGVAGRSSMDSYHREVPRPDSRGSNAAARSFSPRKSSLSQPDVPPDMPPATAAAAATSKPLPFVRPAEIYKRMEEEREKERKSQELPRPSMDAIHRDMPSDAPPLPQSAIPDMEMNRRKQPALDTVAERRSEYGLEHKTDTVPLSAAAATPIQPINTDVSQQMSYPSASSKYTDRPDPVSATTEDSRFPSRSTSQQQRDYGTTASLLPQISRSSTFGSDFVRRDSTSSDSAQQSHGGPPVPPKDGLATVPENSGELQHKTSLGYRTMVNDVFEAENQKRGSPTTSQDSMLRSNTTSTSDISPIVERSKEQPWNRPTQQAATQEEHLEEDLPTPRRLGTNRRESPSPARRPLNAESPQVPEPQSAILMEDTPTITRDTATQAHMVRPGPAILVHQQPRSRDSVNAQEAPAAIQVEAPSLRKQESQASGISDQRTASEEWREWSATKQEIHARHGFKDSNPTTPGVESSSLSSPAPALDSFQRSVQAPTDRGLQNSVDSSTGVASPPPTTRPNVTRDESFRPSLPGGWLSSTSVPTVDTPEPSIASVVSPHRPGLAGDNARSESVESVPTATAPKRDNWRSEYSGIQAQAFAAAATAGSALAGIFNGPSLTSSTTDDSEVSSINEHDEDSAGRNRESAVAARDLAATPPVGQSTVPNRSTARDFASTPSTSEEATPVARGRHFPTDTTRQHPSAPATAGALASGPEFKKNPSSIARDDSPSKGSDRWWSDDEESRSVTGDVPAPLRTKRPVGPKDSTRPPATHSDSEDGPDPEQLETDIVKSLTPKSSSMHRHNEAEKQRQLGRAGESDSLRPISPPFAAAALALSPSRENKSLQEQNSFKPLQALKAEEHKMDRPGNVLRDPQVATGSTSATTTLPPVDNQEDQNAISAPLWPQHDRFNGIASPLAATSSIGLAKDATAAHPEDNQAIHNRLSQPVSSTTASITGQPLSSTATGKKVESPALARLNSLAKKEFTIMHDGPVAFPSTQPYNMRGPLGNQAVQSPVAPYDDKRANTLENKVTTSLSTPASADDDTTLSTPQNKGKGLTPVRAAVAETNQTLGESNRMATAVPMESDEDESRSISTIAPAVSPSQESPRSATAVSDITARPSTPSSKAAAPTAASTSASIMSRAPQTAQLPHPYDPNTAFPVDKIPVSQIFRMGNAQQRIKAYEENRDVYVQPVGHLETWLSSLNTPEHADIFSGQRPAGAQYATPPRVHHARESSGPKQMQEDGRRLFEGAKKYGGKASVLGKGLFSRGKEKLRTVSANNKGTRKAPSSADTSQHSSASASAPQLPTPSTTTPMDETSLSQYFTAKQPGDSGVTGPRGIERSTVQPPFSPISEVSTRETDRLSTPYKPISNISQDQTPRSQNTVKHLPATTSNAAPRSPTDTVDKRKSAAAVSTIDSEHDAGRFSADMLNPSGDENRRGSSVSDVSSVSDHPRRQSMATRTVSPPIEQQASRNEPTHAAVDVASTAPPVPSVTATKAEEAEEDRQEEETLPRYNQPSVQPSRMSPGAQVVPVAQLGRDQDMPVERSRPFSFVGNDSLLHTGRPGTHTMDSLDAQTKSFTGDSNANARNANHQPNNALVLGVQSDADQEKSESPLPSARRPPEELAKYRHNAPPFVPQEEEGGFRIPGPYTRELRSPKPKSQSPIKEQVQPDYPPSAPQEAIFDSPAAVSSAQPGHMYQQPQEPQHQQRYLQQQIQSAAITQGSNSDRGRKGSKLGSLFRSGSKSQSRNQREADQPRPEMDNRRNSLFKLGSRTSINSRGADGEQYDEVANQQRPQSGPRKLSKDLFKSTTFNQPQPGQANYVRPAVQGQEQSTGTPAGKKKRFSGLFGKSPAKEHRQQQAPSRASTLPFNAQNPNMQSQSLYSQHPANQQRFANQPPQQFQGMQSPQEGYYGQPHGQPFGQPGHSGAYQTQQAYGQQQSQYGPAPTQISFYSQATSPTPQDQRQAPGSWQQQGPQSYHYNQQQQYQSGPVGQHNTDQRPDLRVDTGDQPSGSVPASAPPVPSSYLQSRPAGGVQSSSSTVAPHLQQAQAPPQIPQTRANKDISYGSDLRHNTASPTGEYTQPSAAQQASNITPRVQALHTRSRSPKLGRPTSEDLTEEMNTLAPSPANDLGTFSSKKVSPVGGIARPPEDQEKPWKIGLPGDDAQTEQNTGPSSATSSRAREVKRIMLERAGDNGNNGGDVTSPGAEPSRPQTVAERYMGHGMPPPNDTVRTRQTPAAASTSTTAGTASSAKPFYPNAAASETPLLRGKGQGPMLSNNGVPGEDASVSNQGNSGTVSSTNANSTGPNRPANEFSAPSTMTEPWSQSKPQTKENDLGRSPTGERNEHYPVSTITALAHQNKSITGNTPEQHSQTQKPSIRSEQPAQSRFAAPDGGDNTTRNSVPNENFQPHPSHPHDPRTSVTYAPTPPPEPKTTARVPPETSKAVEVHELVGSRPEGYESDDEPMMSATAYPGQEWQPVFDRWDD